MIDSSQKTKKLFCSMIFKIKFLHKIIKQTAFVFYTIDLNLIVDYISLCMLYYNYRKGKKVDIKRYIQDSIDTKTKILNNKNILGTVEKIADRIVETYRFDKKVLTAGNGGSACDSQHIAGELVAKFFIDRPGLNAISLVNYISSLTATSNDYGYEKSFSRQIQALANKGDVFIAISTSGNSKNIILALEMAKKKGVVTVGLVGSKECEMDKLCDYIIHVPSASTPTIQESHIMIGHIICALVEETIFTK